MSKSKFRRVFLCVLIPITLLLLIAAQPAIADCRAPVACIECHATIGYPPASVLENIAQGTCERGDFGRGHDLSVPRFIHRAALLDDDRVLLTGGARAIWVITNTVDVFDPSNNSISPAAAMSVKRWSHTATTLADGRVMVTGGRTGVSANPASSFFGVVLDTSELYDPATDSWSPTGSMNVARRSATQTLLPDGRVLICGGGDGVSTGTAMAIASCETFDATTGTFTLVGTMTTPRSAHSANLLDDGTVLITGGSNGAGTSAPTTLAEIFDPATNTFTAVGPMNFPHLAQTGAKMRDGRVMLAASYYGSGGITDDSEIYDPVSQTFTIAPSMFKQRIDIGGQPLLDGTVLVAGGVATGAFPSVFHSSSEVYDPVADKWRLSGIMADGRDEFSGALLNDGRVLVAGGFTRDPSSRLLDSVEIYSPGLTQQIAGLLNVVGDMPLSVFKNGWPGQNDLIGAINSVGAALSGSGNQGPNYDKARRAAVNLQDKLNKKVVDAEALLRLHSIVQVLIDSLDQKLSPNVPPTVAPTATPDTGTEPLPVTFAANASDSDGAIASVLWLFGDGAIANEPNPAHTYACDGNYTATVQATDDKGAVASGDVTVTVVPAGGPLTYDCDVQPVFNANCISCHGSSGGVSLGNCDAVQGSKDIVDPGSKETSPLWLRIDAGTMPPVGGRLPQADIDNIGAWIDGLNPADPDFCD